jgi:hypothetical protein
MKDNSFKDPNEAGHGGYPKEAEAVGQPPASPVSKNKIKYPHQTSGHQPCNEKIHWMGLMPDSTEKVEKIGKVKDFAIAALSVFIFF